MPVRSISKASQSTASTEDTISDDQSSFFARNQRDRSKVRKMKKGVSRGIKDSYWRYQLTAKSHENQYITIGVDNIVMIEGILRRFRERAIAKIRQELVKAEIKGEVKKYMMLPWVNSLTTTVQDAYEHLRSSPLETRIYELNKVIDVTKQAWFPPYTVSMVFRRITVVTIPPINLKKLNRSLPQDGSSSESPEIKGSFEGVVGDFVRESRSSLGISSSVPTSPIRTTTAKKLPKRPRQKKTIVKKPTA